MSAISHTETSNPRVSYGGQILRKIHDSCMARGLAGMIQLFAKRLARVCSWYGPRYILVVIVS